MDKKKWRCVSPRDIFKNLSTVLAAIVRAVLAVGGCAAFVYGTFRLAKEGSPLFYYAIAFASPGTVAEMWLDDAIIEPDEILSTDENTTPEREETPPENEHEDEHSGEQAVLKPEHEVPEVPEKRRGTVKEVFYAPAAGGAYIAYEHAMIKNCTTYGSEKILSVLKTKTELSLSTDSPETPQVLIYHTHATEGYEPADRGYFDTAGTWRSTDLSENMASVGDVICAVLKENGIGVIHDTTLHDDPSYKGSYQRSAVTIKKHLKENPTIKICLDIHRDAIEPSETEIIKPTAVIDGKKAAQIMIISGCDDGTMNMPNFFENLRFAAALADKMQELYPGLCRPVLFDYRKYNMDLSPGLLLIEIGATGNTLDEAKYSAELLANALVALCAAE